MDDRAAGQTAFDPASERIRALEASPLPANISSLLDDAAREAGDNIVWNFFEEGRSETYAALNRRVNGICAGLQQLGLMKGSIVAAMLPNIPELPMLWLALARLGAVLVPTNIAYRERELAYVLNDSGADYIVVDAALCPIVQACRDAGQIALPREHEIVVGAAPEGGRKGWADIDHGPLDSFVPAEAAGQDDLLNIQYTSGTTGFPKGCMLTQRYWLVAGKVNAFRDGNRYERILASTPFFYMDPQWLLLMAIYQRGTLFVARRQSTSRYMEWLRQLDIQFCLLPWVVYKQPPHALDARNSIKRANVYGIPRELHGDLERRFGLVAREAYGMTEVGPAAFMPIEAGDMVGSGSCGRRGPYRECRIADERGNTLAPGETGELLIRGPGIMKGYYKNPEATAAAFHGDWFRTSDLFRMDERGYLYIVGRLKDMVRRSGENIAARELESVLNAAPDVLESAVIPVPDEVRGEEVKACIVLREGHSFSPELLDGLIVHCQRNLAAFKVPRYFSFHDSFPRTASMKIAKQALRGADAPRQSTFDRVENRWR